MTRTTLFQTNRSQAMRLPKDVAFPAGVREVAILRDGARQVIVPADALWDDFFDSPGIELGEREQPRELQRMRPRSGRRWSGAARSSAPTTC